jgi:2-desacetyl-2-hydroxyethyl bacteriochlorophyllide A dehydrogenase
MRAVVITGYGAPLSAAELPDPIAEASEVLVLVEAAGMCRSDIHYRSGTRPVPSLPLVPGHEVAGTVIAVGDGVTDRAVGDRVCLHYLVTCGACSQCRRGAEQFCEVGQMIGLDRQGGYAEQIVVPARNAHLIPAGVDTAVAAIMMCSSSTALHALRRGEVAPGSSVAIFGAGGLGVSAIRLAQILGASRVFAVDVNPRKLEAAAALGAVPIDGNADPAAALLAAGGMDVALELVGSAEVMKSALDSLAPSGRAVAVGITDREFGLDPYRDLVKREVDLRGSADHLASEIEELLTMAGDGTLDLGEAITRRIPLDAAAVTDAMDRLEAFGDDIRVVIEP